MSKYAFVTGCSRGIGLEFAKQLAAKGYHVFASARNTSQSKGLLDLQQKYSDKVTLLNVDVVNEKSIQSAFEQVKKVTDRVDLVINNAGILHRESNLNDVTVDNLVNAFMTNAVGPLLVARTFLPLLKQSSDPIIANVTSRMGSIDDNTSGGMYSYRASKTALNMINKSLAIETKDANVICLVLHPGMVETDMTKGYTCQHKPEDAARNLLDIIYNAKMSDSGKFISWDKSIIPW